MRKSLIHLFGNKAGQLFLERVVRKAQNYLGVGSADRVEGSGESGVLLQLKARETPPYCIFDVGSHQGQYLDLVLSILGNRDFNIHCFEPSPRFIEILTSKADGDKRIKFNPIGLGERKGEFNLFFEHEESGGSLSQRRLDYLGISFDRSEKVTIDTLDNYCKEWAIDYIHLLKADIEGHEMDLFKGARKMFDKRAIGMATFEFGGCNLDTRTFFKDFFYFLKDQGMDLYRITPAGYLYPLPTYREIDEQFRTTNFVAIRK